jgi:hypothetical protein
MVMTCTDEWVHRAHSELWRKLQSEALGSRCGSIPDRLNMSHSLEMLRAQIEPWGSGGGKGNGGMVVACPFSSGLSAVSFIHSFFTLLFYLPIYVNTIRRLSYIETHVPTIRKHRPCFSPKEFC